jgi:hypothetical protein
VNTSGASKGRGRKERPQLASPRWAKQNPREAKLTRGSSGSQAKPLRLATDSRTEQSPVVERGRAGVVGNRRQAKPRNGARVTASDELVRRCGTQNPWRANPGRGSGAKQTRKVGRGANRRGRAKRRGRNEASLGVGSRRWTLRIDVAMGKETPRKAIGAGRQRSDPGTRHSEEAPKRTRG